MHRVDGADFAVGNLFREGNPALGLLATQITADIMNALQQEVAAVIEGEGIALVKADNTQLKAAIEKTVSRVGGLRYVNANTLLTGGTYLVDTSGGAITLTLPVAPVAGTAITFIDARASWTAFNFTLGRNGKTIMTQAADLIANVADQQFSIWFNGVDWRLV